MIDRTHNSEDVRADAQLPNSRKAGNQIKPGEVKTQPKGPRHIEEEPQAGGCHFPQLKTITTTRIIKPMDFKPITQPRMAPMIDERESLAPQKVRKVEEESGG